ncbi:hypothetical protein Rcae01_00056 [Novipirellula caenicola]|uniref:Uncharacterized protein n=2 Tax=Novipirellula caenicola TaxID=1536901 RepID=A0ABP9VHC8_9BACT
MMRNYFFILHLCVVIFSGCSGSTVVATIDAEVADTQVFHRGQLLGTTPLLVTEEMCRQHGFAIPEDYIETDGWGEWIEFDSADGSGTKKLTFLVSESVREQYLTLETPWGIRTKRSGSRGNYNGTSINLTTGFMPLVDKDGIRLELHDLGKYAAGDKVELRLTLIGTGDKPVAGFRPELMALWGDQDAVWCARSCSKMELDERFSTIEPGERHEITMLIDAPDKPAAYSLFVVYHLFSDEDGDSLKINAVYSESQLLSVAENNELDRETGRQGDTETRRHGDTETRRHGDTETRSEE